MSPTPSSSQALPNSRTTTGVAIFGGLFLLLGLVFLLSLSLGSQAIPLAETWTVLTGGEASKTAWEKIILNIRLPQAITALLAGAALSTAGLQMQTLFRNPLADPFVLGVNAGAGLGVALVVLFVGTTGVALLDQLALTGVLSVIGASTLGSLVVMLIVLLIGRRVDGMTLLIFGLMLGYATSALVQVLLYFSIPEKIQAYMSWTFGNFGGVTWNHIPAFSGALLIGLAIAASLGKSLNALLLGEAYAESMGLNLKRTQLLIILSTSLLAGTVTGFCGPIGFIGIAVPHLCRMIFHSSNHQILIPATILVGGLTTLTADLISRLPGSNLSLPLNAVTALIGTPVIIWLLLKKRTFSQGQKGEL